MKLVLVQPDESQVEILPVRLRPLALESIAAHLTDGHEVLIVDERVDDVPLEQQLARFDPDIVGVTCTFTSGVTVAQQVLQRVREAAPRAKIVVGGVHASLVPGDFSYPLADFLVRGPGGPTLRELVDQLERRGDTSEVRGLYIADGAGLRYTGDRNGPRWSASYRLPARQLTERYRGRYTPAPNGRELVLMVSSRGCPYRCTFCAAWRLQQGKLDTRSVESLFDEIRSVEEDFVYFFDDNTFANRQVMDDLARQLCSAGIEKQYQVWTSTNLICRAPELLERWRDAGLVRVFCGFESLNDERLKRFDKRASRADNDHATAICDQLGIDLTATFIVDPNFTEADFDALGSYARQLGIQLPYFLILTPLPGTQLFEQLAHGIIEGDPARYDLMHLTTRPRLDPGPFMERFVALYFDNTSWQAARGHPVYGSFLANVEALREQAAPSRPIQGFRPDQAVLFPQQG